VRGPIPKLTLVSNAMTVPYAYLHCLAASSL
jgi:hypothetical protein